MFFTLTLLISAILLIIIAIDVNTPTYFTFALYKVLPVGLAAALLFWAACQFLTGNPYPVM